MATPSQYEGRPDIPAPEFLANLDWINTPAPLTLKALRGKIVLMDFWTYGCINCIHMIPVLEQLERKYPDELVVIGVHSAKFKNEGDTENLRQIAQRYELHHPIINDRDFATWQQYGVRGWPSFVVVDPRGNVLAMQSGEIPFEAFDRLISGMIAHFDALGEINREPIPLQLEGAGQMAQALSYPGKVLADAASKRLFISDSNHHRIIVADLATYRILDVIGVGARGFKDGDFNSASFFKPQGIALHPTENKLYITDTENHAIRVADLTSRTVTTIAGTGEQHYLRVSVGKMLHALEIPLNSPWDLTFTDDETLYIAMAGPHQLWEMNIKHGEIAPMVGNGREALLDGTFENAELAQPSGVYHHDGVVYFADSESSTIRAANLKTRTVKIVSGTTENNLFDFGDKDGAVGVSRIQHPLGVAGDADGTIYFADTYNSKIKAINPQTNVTTTLFGMGSPGGFKDGGEDAEFNEPGGLSVANGRLYVADTNNHAIRVIDLSTQRVSTIVFPNPHQLVIGGKMTVVSGNMSEGAKLYLPQQEVAPGEAQILLRLNLPEGFKLNLNAPSSAEWNNTGGAADIPEAHRSGKITRDELRIPVNLQAGYDRIYGVLNIYYCHEADEGLCYIDRVSVEAPIHVSADTDNNRITIDRAIFPPLGTF